MRTRLAVVALLLTAILVSQMTGRGTGQPNDPTAALMAQAQTRGSVRVIVHLQAPFVPEPQLATPAHISAQRANIARLRADVRTSLRGIAHTVVREYDALPFLALEVGPDALRMLGSLPGMVAHVEEDALAAPMLAESVPLIQGDQAWAAGFDGTGQIVAILDTGVDKNHPFLAGKVVAEACFSSTNAAQGSTSTCPGGVATSTAPDSALPCAFGSCFHGTHVAGIAAGSGAGAGVAFSGVAKGAKIIAIQIFSRFDSIAICGAGQSPCALTFSSDQLAALNYLFTVRNNFTGLNVASANMSIGGGQNFAPCDTNSLKVAVDQLRGANIATAIASGNDGFTNAISSPACISTAISVGSTMDGSNNAVPVDGVSSFSNTATFLSLLAPGQVITSSLPGTGFGNLQGTSMATPHVAGAFALLKQAAPTADVGTLLLALQNTGLAITDNRAIPAVVKPRIRVRDAIAAVSTPSQITTLNPASVVAYGPDFTLTVNGTSFPPDAVVQINGTARQTTFVNATQLTAQILAADIATTATGVGVTVFAPSLNLTSSPATLTILQPTLVASPAIGPPGSPLTVTLTNWAGGNADWLAIAPTGAVNTNYLPTYVYVLNLPGSGGTKTWTTTMPATLGSYEARLFLNNGFTRAATSNTITDANVSLTPTIATLSPASVAAGSSAFTLRVNGTGFVTGATATVGGVARTATFVSATQMDISVQAADVASIGSVDIQVTDPTPCVPTGCVSNTLPLPVTAPPAAPVLTSIAPTTAPSGGASFTLTATGQNFVPTSVVRINGSARATTYGSSTSVTATILASDIASAGTPAITVATPAPCVGAAAGFCVSSAQTLTVTGPALTASPATGPPGSTLTITLTNWAGGSQDWLALAPLGAANTTYLIPYAYVNTLPGAGGTKTWTTTIPATLGSYEARLFLNNGFTRAATSNTITDANINPTPTIASLAPVSVAAGSAAFTLRVNGAGFVTGATATVGGAARSVSFVSATQLDVSVQAADVAAVGSVNIQVTDPTPCVPTGCVSNTMALAVTAPPAAPTLSSIAPNTGAAGGASFTLTATGTNFVPTSVVRVNGSARATTFATSTSLTATIPAGDIASAGALAVTVATPAPCVGAVAGFCVSGPQTLTVTGPALNASPTTGPPGSTLTITLTNWAGGSQDWLALAPTGAANATYLVPYAYVNTLPGTGGTKTWTTTMPATLGTYEPRLFLNNGFTRAATGNTITVANINPTPAITTLAPASVAAGSAAFTLHVNGTGFVNGATATVGGTARTATFVSGTQLDVSVQAADVAAVGSVNVQVTNPTACAPTGCLSNTIALAVTTPPAAPVLNSILPTTAAGGGASFMLTATGQNFVPTSVVRVNGSARATTFGGSTSLTATILASDIASAGTPAIAVATPAPCVGAVAGFCVSGSQTLTVTGPALNASPTTGPPGSTLTITLTDWAGGSQDWLALAPTGAPNTTYVLPYVYVNTLPGIGNLKTWTTTMPATLGTYEPRLFLNNGFARAATGNTITVANISPTPALTTLSPGSVAAGSAAFTLHLTGTGFVTGMTATIGGAARTTTFVSGTQLDVSVQAADVAGIGAVNIQVTAPTPCVPTGCLSNTVALAVTTPPAAPVLSSIAPNTGAAGGASFTLTATGTNFVPTSVVRVNGSTRPTTFGTSTSLTAAIPAGDIASAGALAITVATPAPCVGAVAGFCVSAPQTLTVTGPALGATPTTGPSGSTLTITLTAWAGGNMDWLAIAPSGAPDTTYLPGYVYVSTLSGSGGTKTWTTTMPAAGTYEARLFLNNGFTRAATSATITVTPPPPAQVRFRNNLVFCNPTCNVTFTGVLTASQGYTWTAFSGTSSPYQPVTTATLSNFTLNAVGIGSLTFAGSLPITPGRNEALTTTSDASGNLLLVLADEGSVSGLGSPSAPAASLSLSSQPSGAGSLRFAPASPALAPR